jgi:hypothetical protein
MPRSPWAAGLFRPGEPAFDDDEEQRDEEDRQHCCRDHAAQDGRADGLTPVGPGAARKDQWNDPGDEGDAGHHDRAKAQTGGFERGGERGKAATERRFGEFDDENGVLGGKADGGEQGDLKEDVVGKTAQGRGKDRADDPERDDQHDRERHRPAFVQGCKAQENEQD